MCDTNWCTFCDRAVSPLSNSIYCSEACFRQDAKQEQVKIYTIPPIEKRRDSQSSLCSEDLAALHFDDIPELSRSITSSSNSSLK